MNNNLKSPGCFAFSLKSNGRINGMKKFEQKDGCDGLQIYDKSSSSLFGIAGIWWIHKENTKNTSDVAEFESCFDFHGLSNVFLSYSAGGSWKKFTPTRITVIQMN